MAALASERGKALTGYAYLLTGDLRDAEDLVQDALVKTFVRARSIERGALESYVRRSILTTYVDGYRRRRRWESVRHLLVRDDRSEGPAEAASLRVDVIAALRALPAQQRACVVLRFYDDLTVGEVADRMGLRVGTVKRYLSLAVHRIEGLTGLQASAPDGEPVQLETFAAVKKGKAK